MFAKLHPTRSPNGRCLILAEALADVSTLNPVACLVVAERLYQVQFSAITPAILTIRSEADTNNLKQISFESGIAIEFVPSMPPLFVTMYDGEPDLTPYLGQAMTVQIDRPMGSRHPRFPDMVYPVSYGFLPGTISGDGAEIDAYVLGLDAPAPDATGTVIAIIKRADDNEDKLVIAVDNQTRSPAEIARTVAFCERYFKTTIITPATI